MERDDSPEKVASNAGLGAADDIQDSPRAMIYRWQNCTKLHIARKAPGCFVGHPDMVWSRRLSDAETAAMLENPWRVFERPEANVGPNLM